MRSVLSIDPGREAGWCFSVGGVIHYAGHVQPYKGQSIPNFEFTVDVVVCEYAVDYRGSTPPDSLFRLCVTMGWLTDAYRRAMVPIEMVRPSEWKGNLSKEMAWDRAKKRFFATEVSALERSLCCVAPSKRNHVQDAIELNLWWLRWKEGQKR